MLRKHQIRRAIVLSFSIGFFAQLTNAETLDGSSMDSFVYPKQFSGVGLPSRDGTWFSRWAEDWSYLKDSSRRSGALDGLKYIPLNSTESVWVTVSGEERLRVNELKAPGLQSDSSQQQRLLRSVIGADIHVGTDFRTYVEIARGTMWGNNLSTRPVAEQNSAILQQGFFDITSHFSEGEVGLRVGRQEFADGPLQMVGIRDTPNIRFTLNGVRAWVNGTKSRATLFDFRYTHEDSSAWHDGVDASRGVRGVLLGNRLPVEGLWFAEPFWFQAYDNAMSYGGQLARETRNFGGLRIRGAKGPISSDSVYINQTGHFGERDIQAWSAHTSWAIQLNNSDFRPKVGFHADVSTGGNAYGTGKVATSSYLFGVVPYYSYGSFINGSNLRILAPTLSLSIARNAQLTFEVERLRRYSKDDAVYNGYGQPYAGTGRAQGSDVGTIYRIGWDVGLVRYVSLTTQLEYLSPARVLSGAGYRRSAYASTYLTFRF